MRKIVIAALSVFFAAPATAADFPVKATPAVAAAGLYSGPYFGIGTYLETTQSQFTIGGVSLTSNADTGSLGGIVGIARSVGNNWIAFEGGAYWQNLTNAGTVATVASMQSNFSATGFFEVGIPPGLNILPQVTSLFPGFNSGSAAANMYPYLGVGFHADDVSASVLASNGKDWLIPFAARTGVKTKLSNGSVMDVWGDINFKGSGFSIGPVRVNQSNGYRVGTSFLVSAF